MASRSCPPRSVTSGASSSSVRSATNSATSVGAPSRNCSRSAGPASPNNDWYCSFGIPSIQSRSAVTARPGVRRLQPPAVLDLDDVPAGGLELPAPLVDPDAGHDPVQRLAVEVDQPHHVAEPGGGRVGDRLPDVPLVQLGVADERDEPGVRAARRSGRRRTGGSPRRTAGPPRPARPSRWRSRPRPGPWSGDGYDCSPPRARSRVRYDRSRLPSRYWIAWKTGEACGLTATRSSASRWANQSAVIAVTSEALDAWCPPTFTPSPVSRSWLAASTIRVASHSTRRWISSRTSRSCSFTGTPSGRRR